MPTRAEWPLISMPCDGVMFAAGQGEPGRPSVARGFVIGVAVRCEHVNHRFW